MDAQYWQIKSTDPGLYFCSSGDYFRDTEWDGVFFIQNTPVILGSVITTEVFHPLCWRGSRFTLISQIKISVTYGQWLEILIKAVASKENGLPDYWSQSGWHPAECSWANYQKIQPDQHDC